MSYQEFRPRSFDTLPPVIKNLLIINILMFAATWVLKNRMGIDLTEILGLHYVGAGHFRPYQFVTYLFMHGSFQHLFFNMFAIWMFGSVIENTWGQKRFLIYYLVTGFGAAIVQYIIIYFQISPVLESIQYTQEHLTAESFEAFVSSPEVTKHLDYDLYMKLVKEIAPAYDEALRVAPQKAMSIASSFISEFRADYLNSFVVIGASGSLFGLLLAFGMMFPNTLIYLYFFVPIKAKWLVTGYGLLELISGLSNNADDNVAHFAHLGGMLFGFFMILIWKRNRNFFY